MKTTRLFAIFAGLLILAACAGNKTTKETKAVDDDSFYATQPVVSGQYRAVSYDIEGDKARKGKFDGRIFVALSPEQSGIYVYENGNRTKIDYTVVLSAPFEKGDSGIYTTTDNHGLPVTVRTDSLYTLSFEKKSGKVSIGFEPTPMWTGTALQTLERITEQKGK